MLWAADIPGHLEWCMRQFACCSTVGDAFRREIEELYERPEAVRSALELQARLGKDPAYTVEDFLRDQDVPYVNKEVEEALARLDAISARSLRVETPHWAPTLARRLEMQRLRAIKERGIPTPRYNDVLKRMEEAIVRIQKREAEKDHRNIDADETDEVLQFLESRADEMARDRAWRVKDISGSVDADVSGCFRELHEWIVVPEVLNEEALKDRKRHGTSRLAPVDAEDARRERMEKFQPTVGFAAPASKGEHAAPPALGAGDEEAKGVEGAAYVVGGYLSWCRCLHGHLPTCRRCVRVRVCVSACVCLCVCVRVCVCGCMCVAVWTPQRCTHPAASWCHLWAQYTRSPGS